MVSSGRVGGGCENTIQSNPQWVCNSHHLTCSVDVNCQYNYVHILEVVMLFLHFIDVTSLTRYGDSDGVSYGESVLGDENDGPRVFMASDERFQWLCSASHSQCLQTPLHSLSPCMQWAGLLLPVYS